MNLRLRGQRKTKISWCDPLRDLVLLLLRNALANPDNIADLLLLQLQVAVEDTTLQDRGGSSATREKGATSTNMELLHECVLVQVDLVLEKFVLQRLLRADAVGIHE